MKKSVTVVLVAGLCAAAGAAKKRTTDGLEGPVAAEVSARVEAAAKKPHPRLFADAAGFDALKARAASDEWVKMGAELVRRQADALVGGKIPERVMEGRRLLGVSRTALFRVSALALAYRLYGDARHLDQAVKELRAVCAFSDWNPSHFLDTAEMSLAVATGYDWLYHDLDAAARREIAAALRRHGLDASRKPAWWIRTNNNWGQVCHAGMLAAALALAEEDPADAARFVQRCVTCIRPSMASLAPNGNYPEGPGYWHYGTEFNFVAVALLEGTLGSDFGLCALPGFKETAAYPDLVTGPSGLTFNYADGGSGRGTCPATWWFAARFGRPELLRYFEAKAYRAACAAKPRKGREKGNRLFPYGLFWVKAPAATDAALPRVWDAGGPVPITVQRSSWNDDEALFAGLKGGSPRANHGHMDGGSFVLDTKGVRWAVDLGAENYHGIEKRGMNLWSPAQDGQRWTIYRLGTSAHNVLMLDGAQQRAEGSATVTRVTEGAEGSEVELDLTTLYPAAKKVTRTGTLAADGRTYRIRDKVEGMRAGGRVRWAMTTRAAARVEGDSVVLEQAGQTLRVTSCGRDRGAWELAPARGPNVWDSPNPGCTQLTFTAVADARGAAELEVVFERGPGKDR